MGFRDYIKRIFKRRDRIRKITSASAKANKPEPPPEVKPKPEDSDYLGSLSAVYESGKKSSEAIGWDPAGGASYGKYQIAVKVGTMNLYLDFVQECYPDIYKELAPLAKTKSDKKGLFAQKWKELAKAGKLEDSEHAFIKATHYDSAYHRLNKDVRKLVDDSWTIKQVLWSTAVQHGPKGAGTIFNSAGAVELENMKAFINFVYYKRAKRLSHLPTSIQKAVRNRYVSEKDRAFKMLEVYG